LLVYFVAPMAGLAPKVLRGAQNKLLQLRDGFPEEEQLARAKEEERRQLLALRMSNAETREQWEFAATELDILEGNEAWKFDNSSEYFDAPLIRARLAHMDEAIELDMAGASIEGILVIKNHRTFCG